MRKSSFCSVPCNYVNTELLHSCQINHESHWKAFGWIKYWFLIRKSTSCEPWDKHSAADLKAFQGETLSGHRQEIKRRSAGRMAVSFRFPNQWKTNTLCLAKSKSGRQICGPADVAGLQLPSFLTVGHPGGGWWELGFINKWARGSPSLD